MVFGLHQMLLIVPGLASPPTTRLSEALNQTPDCFSLKALPFNIICSHSVMPFWPKVLQVARPINPLLARSIDVKKKCCLGV